MENKIMVELDQATFRLKCITSAVNAIHTAMTEGGSEPKEWLDGLFFAYEGLWDVTKQFESIMEKGKGNED